MVFLLLLHLSFLAQALLVNVSSIMTHVSLLLSLPARLCSAAQHVSCTGFCLIPSESVGLCFGMRASYCRLFSSWWNSFWALADQVNSSRYSRATSAPQLRDPSEESNRAPVPCALSLLGRTLFPALGKAPCVGSAGSWRFPPTRDVWVSFQPEDGGSWWSQQRPPCGSFSQELCPVHVSTLASWTPFSASSIQQDLRLPWGKPLPVCWSGESSRK